MRARRWTTVAVATVAAIGCVAPAVTSAAEPTPGPRIGSATVYHRHHAKQSHRPLEFLHVGAVGSDGLKQIVDSSGRSVLLRGVNIDGLVDYWQSDLKKPYPSTTRPYSHGRCPKDNVHVEGVEICSYDFKQMRAEGYDNIRLNVSWSLLEPTPGHISRSYINRIAQVVGWARKVGIYVTIDMHQDAWGKYVYTPKGTVCPSPIANATPGFDGAPRWADLSTLPPCAVANVSELDLEVEGDAQDFWDDAKASDGVGLQEHYASVVTALAKRFAHDPAVVGYDLMNEPLPGFAPEADSTAELMPFYAKVVATVREDVRGFKQLFFIEPGAERNTTAQRAFFTPWSAVSSYKNVVYAPHIYTDVFTAASVAGLPFDPVTSSEDYSAAIGDAKALGLPIWVGEFGCPPTKDATLLHNQYAEQEAMRIGGTLWLWKENANSASPNSFWGIYGPPFSGKTKRGIRQPERVMITSRVYPVMTDGTLLSTVSNPKAGTATITATASKRVSSRKHATLVEIPGQFRGHVTAKGARIHVFKFHGARQAWVFPNGGAYSVHVRPRKQRAQR